MNIFVLSENPYEAAWMQCDKHVVKMVTESAQMLSTAHRMLDGEMYTEKSANGRNIKRWRLDDDREDVLMKACHTGHPCTLWTMASKTNYHWHYQHYHGLAEEYEYRYGKKHGAFNRDTTIYKLLGKFPKNISDGGQTPFALAMKNNPECIVEGYDKPRNAQDVQSYRNYYHTKQDNFKMVWTKRDVPSWFKCREKGLLFA